MPATGQPLDPEARAAIEEILRGIGAEPQEIDQALEEGSWDRLITEVLLWPDRERLTVAEVARRAGVTEDLARRIRQRAGLPDPGEEAACRSIEVELVRSFAAGAELFGEEPTLQFTRVINRTTAVIAEAAWGIFAAALARPLVAREHHEVEMARASRDAMLAFTTVPAAVEAGLRLHFEAAVARFGPIGPDPARWWSIAFVDLVDSTVLANRVGAGELADALVIFDGLASDVALEQGVRLVKLLGDGAMLVAPHPDHLADAAIDLVRRVGDDSRLGLARGGLAFGPTTIQEGDYFGPTVNLASRVAQAATAGTVLCDEEAARHLDGRCRTAGQFDLKGFDHPLPLYLLGEPPGA